MPLLSPSPLYSSDQHAKQKPPRVDPSASTVCPSLVAWGAHDRALWLANSQDAKLRGVGEKRHRPEAASLRAKAVMGRG
jgi:hypothetical protein